jgi:hypothetical protein
MNQDQRPAESNQGPTELLAPKGVEISLVQHRLTIAGLALTTLFFSASFSLSLYGLLHPQEAIDYRIEFAPIETSLALGVTTCLAAILSFLVSQQLAETSRGWYLSRRLWFAVGNVWLYLTLSQAMSAGLTEIVHGVALFRPAIGEALGLLATPVWILLLVGAPLQLILRSRSIFSPAERRALVLTYVFSLSIIVVTNAEVYRVRGHDPATFSGFFGNVLVQFVQPVTWANTWFLSGRRLR